MIKAIDKKYCIENLVQLMPETDACQLIVSADEIILLKIGNRVVVNKYANHSNRNLFPYSDKEQSDWKHFNELFEYNRTYLNYKGSVSGYSFQKYYFFKGNDRALWLNVPLPVDERNAVENSAQLSRKEIEKIFDSDSYDAMYVVDRNGIIPFARNKKDNICIGKKIIPSDKEIVEMELGNRKMDYNIGRALFSKNDTHEKYIQSNTPKKIENIKDFNLYGPALFGTYSHMLLTVKDGKFDLQWFRIDFVEKDKFKLTTSPIPITEPTVDDVLHYAENYEIENNCEPYPKLTHNNVQEVSNDGVQEEETEESQRSTNAMTRIRNFIKK